RPGTAVLDPTLARSSASAAVLRTLGSASFSAATHSLSGLPRKTASPFSPARAPGPKVRPRANARATPRHTTTTLRMSVLPASWNGRRGGAEAAHRDSVIWRQYICPQSRGERKNGCGAVLLGREPGQGGGEGLKAEVIMNNRCLGALVCLSVVAAAAWIGGAG